MYYYLTREENVSLWGFDRKINHNKLLPKCKLALNLKHKQWHFMSQGGGSTCSGASHAKNNSGGCFIAVKPAKGASYCKNVPHMYCCEFVETQLKTEYYP